MALEARALLRRLARAHGVQTDYVGQDGSAQTVPDEALVKVLAALGVRVRPDGVAGLAEALEDAETAPWRDVLPPTVAARAGHRLSVPCHVAAGETVTARIHTESGQTLDVDVSEPVVEVRRVDGVARERLHVQVPGDLAPGWHRLEVVSGSGSTASAVLVCAPERLTTAAPFLARRGWGVAAQGYSVTSADSWGIGDAADMAALAELAAPHGADFLLLHPLHAVEPGAEPADSPLLPRVPALPLRAARARAGHPRVRFAARRRAGRAARGRRRRAGTPGALRHDRPPGRGRRPLAGPAPRARRAPLPRARGRLRRLPRRGRAGPGRLRPLVRAAHRRRRPRSGPGRPRLGAGRGARRARAHRARGRGRPAPLGAVGGRRAARRRAAARPRRGHAHGRHGGPGGRGHPRDRGRLDARGRARPRDVRGRPA